MAKLNQNNKASQKKMISRLQWHYGKRNVLGIRRSQGKVQRGGSTKRGDAAERRAASRVHHAAAALARLGERRGAMEARGQRHGGAQPEEEPKQPMEDRPREHRRVY